jgi:hypothetical protein
MCCCWHSKTGVIVCRVLFYLCIFAVTWFVSVVITLNIANECGDEICVLKDIALFILDPDKGYPGLTGLVLSLAVTGFILAIDLIFFWFIPYGCESWWRGEDHKGETPIVIQLSDGSQHITTRTRRRKSKRIIVQHPDEEEEEDDVLPTREPASHPEEDLRFRVVSVDDVPDPGDFRVFDLSSRIPETA